MQITKAASMRYAEELIPGSEAVESAAREAANHGVRDDVSAGLGALLRTLAAAVQARTVVEVGTGSGATGLWITQGMPADGVVTTIDPDGEAQSSARRAFQSAGIPAQRLRAISGQPLDVMPRLADGAYDMAIIRGHVAQIPACTEEAIRLLRSGGVLVVDHLLWGDQVADPAARDETTVMLRDLGRRLAEDERLLPALVPVSDGLFLAVRR